MRIKHGSEIIFDTVLLADQPVMIVFDNEEEKKTVAGMPEGIMKYGI